MKIRAFAGALWGTFLATTLGFAIHCGSDETAASPASDRAARDGSAEDVVEPPIADGKLSRGASGCQPIALGQGQPIDGYTSDVYGFHDAECLPREAALVRNDATDPGGSNGGILRRFTYRVGDTTRTARGTGANGWNGFGYVVNHYGSTAYVSRGTTGTYRSVLAGKHHAIHEFKLRASPGGPVDVTVQWMFATGRSHPIYAVTFDATAAGSNTVNADTRTPYGDMNWDAVENGDVEGVGWGDRHAFRTTGTGAVTVTSAWDYTPTNTVPHAMQWSSSADAEMGLVQTETFEQKIAGGDYGGGLLEGRCWGRTSEAGSGCASAGETMPENWLWPYQLNQYELPFSAKSHRVAWGSSYGAVGQTSVDAFGATFSGFPFMSYSVFVVFGQHSKGAVESQAAAIEADAQTTVRAPRGSLVTRSAPGVGRTDDALRRVAGFDPIFMTWDVESTTNAATLELSSGSRVLENPIVRLFGYEAQEPPSSVKLGGETLTADVDYFATVDREARVLWLTLNGKIRGTNTIEID